MPCAIVGEEIRAQIVMYAAVDEAIKSEVQVNFDGPHTYIECRRSEIGAM
jgi:hypothetical protein